MERSTLTLNGYSRSVDVPDGFTAALIEAVCECGKYQSTTQNTEPRPAPGEDADWIPEIPNPQSKADFVMQEVMDYLLSKHAQCHGRQLRQATETQAQLDAAATKDAVIIVDA